MPWPVYRLLSHLGGNSRFQRVVLTARTLAEMTLLVALSSLLLNASGLETELPTCDTLFSSPSPWHVVSAPPPMPAAPAMSSVAQPSPYIVLRHMFDPVQ